MNNNLLDILNKSVNYLEKKKIGNSRLLVETILSDVLKVQRIMLYANFERVLNGGELTEIRNKLNEILKNNDEKGIDNVFQNKNYGVFNIEDTKNENSVKNLLDKSVSYLEKNGVEESKLIGEIIFSHILKVDRMMLFTKYKDVVEEEYLKRIRKYIQKIGKEKLPLQYLLNEQQFYGRNFYVNKGVLIPRQDTEILVENAINIVKENGIEKCKILDIGAGSGVIGLTMALEIKDSKVMGVDISERALEIANKNKELLNVENIRFFKSNLFENVEYKNFDLIVSNPPYIDENEVDMMSLDTLIYEPMEALFAENEGLYFYYEISKKGYEYIRENGYLLFEIGYKQGEIVKKIMENIGYKNVEIVKDLQGLDRVVKGRK